MNELSKDTWSGVTARPSRAGISLVINDFDGFDLVAHDVTGRLAVHDDGEGGCEVFSLTPNGVLLWSARFDATTPIVLVIEAMRTAVDA